MYVCMTWKADMKLGRQGGLRGSGMSVEESGRLWDVFNIHVYFCNLLPCVMHILNEIFENFLNEFLMSMRMCVQFLWRTEGGVGFPKTRVKGFPNSWTWCREPAQVLCKSSKCLNSSAISLAPALLNFLKRILPFISAGSTFTGVSNQGLKKNSQKNAACLLNEETSTRTAHTLWQVLETTQRWSEVPWGWQWATRKSQDILSKGPHHLWTGEYIIGGGAALNPPPTDMRDVCIFSVALRSEFA